MKIYEVQLKGDDEQVLYKSLVPEVHILEKVATLLSMNQISKIGAINFKDMGDISDRYIQKYLRNEDPEKP